MRYIFITGMGRSGTKFFANLLTKVINASAWHEYIGNREFWLLSWYLEHDVYSIPFLAREKKKIENEFRQPVFIDVNSRLQNCVPALKKVFDQPMIFHLVRDPRETVVSLFTRRDENNIHLVPKNRSEMEHWLDGNKLYRICWNWKTTTEQLLAENTRLIRFEDIRSDFRYFENDFLKPAGLEMNETVYKNAVVKRVNDTKPSWYRFVYSKLKDKSFIKDRLPPFSQWNENDKKMLYDVCGNTMLKCGYSLD